MKITLFREPTSYRWCGTLTPQQRSAGAECQNTPLPRELENNRSRRRLKPERLPTRAVQQIFTEAEITHLEYMHRSEQAEGPRRQGLVAPPVQQPEVSMLVPVDARESGGSARSRLPYGKTRSRKSTERMVQQWHVQKDRLGQEGLDSQEREELLHKLANTGMVMIREKQEVVADVARLIGGSLIAPPIDPVHIQCYFGGLKGFGAVDELVMIVTGGVMVNAVASGADLERVLQYGNHSSVTENLPAIWEKIGEDVRRQKCLVIQKSAAHDIPNLRVSASGGRDTQGSDNQ